MDNTQIRIVKVPIEQTRGVFRPRWFVEIIEGNKITDLGNYPSEHEALSAKLSWIEKTITETNIQ